MAAGIDRPVVNRRRAAGRQNDMLGGEQGQARRAAVAQVERQKSLDRAVIGQQTDCLHPVKNADILALHALFERFCHEFRGQRAGRGRTLTGFMVGLVANVFPVFVRRK